MRHLLFIFLIAFLTIPCSTDAGPANLSQVNDPSDFLTSEIALACYAAIAAFAIGVGIVLEKKGRQKKGKELPDAPVRQFPVLITESGQTEQIVPDLERRIQALEQKLNAQEQENEVLNRRLAEAPELPEEQVAERVTVTQEGPAALKEDEPKSNLTTTIYYLQPAADGRFKTTARVATAAEALYELTYREDNPMEALLQFLDSPDNAFLAIQNEPTWILIACERNNLPDINTTGIRTDVAGRAIFRNDEWEIVQKAKITYI